MHIFCKLAYNIHTFTKNKKSNKFEYAFQKIQNTKKTKLKLNQTKEK